MQRYYSATTRGFYCDEINGDNIPDDAVEISEDNYQDLMDGQSRLMTITPGSDGHPVLALPDPPDPADIIKAKIVALEMMQTPRRMREAALGIDNGWLADIDAQIAMLRAQV